MRTYKEVKNLDWNSPHWTLESFDTLRYFCHEFNKYPNVTYISGQMLCKSNIITDKLIDRLKIMNAELIFKSENFDFMKRKIIYRLGTMLIVSENISVLHIDDLIIDNKDDLKYTDSKGFIEYSSTLTILHLEENVNDDFIQIVKECCIKKENVPLIGIITRDSSGFILNEMKLSLNVSPDLDVHYGIGMEKFHEKIVEKLVNENKGIFLLHGDPGTGKTSYIRKLIYDVKQLSTKKIIIVPSNLITFMIDPEFNSFLIDTIETFRFEDSDYENDLEEKSEPIKGIILVLEDAESVLMKREKGDNSQGTSNILNITDGLFNDLFMIQVICSYNTNDDNIDAAIKRSKRLVAKKHFKKMSIENSQKLIDYLKIEHTTKIDMTVAEVYALLDKEDESILIEKDVKKENAAFKF